MPPIFQPPNTPRAARRSVTQLIVASAICALSAASCGDVTDVDDGTASPSDAVPQAIRRGTADSGGQPGLVLIDLYRGATDTSTICTGALINANTLITAAHCITRLTAAATGTLQGTIYYFDTPAEGGKRQITSRSETVRYYRYEKFNNDVNDGSNDIALVQRDSAPWIRTDESDYLLLHAGGCAQLNDKQFTVFGAGCREDGCTNWGALYYFHTTTDQCSSHSFAYLVDDAALCDRDSGGPTTKSILGSGKDVVMGVHAQFYTRNGSICAGSGLAQHDARIDADVRTWIQQKIGLTCVTENLPSRVNGQVVDRTDTMRCYGAGVVRR